MNKIYHEDHDIDQSLLERLVSLPNRILQLHDVEELSPLVLHELGHDSHFGLKKAVYLIDNPDFDSLKGVAGFCRDECHLHKQNILDDPQSFAHDMAHASFHQSMKQFRDGSIARNHDYCSQDGITHLGERLGLNNPSCCTWNTRHGNQGILLFEADDMKDHQKSLLSQIIALLSFC